MSSAVDGRGSSQPQPSPLSLNHVPSVGNVDVSGMRTNDGLGKSVAISKTSSPDSMSARASSIVNGQS